MNKEPSFFLDQCFNRLQVKSVTRDTSVVKMDKPPGNEFSLRLLTMFSSWFLLRNGLALYFLRLPSIGFGLV